MKRCTTLLFCICVCAGIASTASGGDVCIWTGAVDDDWFNAGNWNGCSGGYPCTGDNASINCNTCNATPAIFDDGAVSCTLDDLNVDATTQATLALDIKAGTLALAATKNTTIRGDDTAAKHATITVSGGTFDPGNLQILGGGAGEGKGTLDFDSGTISEPDSLTMQGLSKIDTEQDMSFSTLDVTIDSDGANATNAEIDVLSGKTMTVADATLDAAAGAVTLKKSGAGTLDVGSMTVQSGGDVNENATLWLNGGEIVIGNNVLALDGGDASTKEALFDFDAGTFPASTHTDWDITMAGDSRIDAEQDIDLVNGDLSVPLGLPAKVTVAEIDMLSGKEFTADVVTVGGNGDTVTLDLTGSGDFTFGAVTISGGSTTGDTTALNAGGGDFTTAAVTITGGTSTGATAELNVTGDDVATAAVTITGGTSSGATAGLNVTSNTFTATGLVTITEGTTESAELDIGTSVVPILDSVTMTGDSNLELASSTRVEGLFHVIASGAVDPTQNLNDGVAVALEAGSLQINAGVTFTPSFLTGSVLITQ